MSTRAPRNGSLITSLLTLVFAALLAVPTALAQTAEPAVAAELAAKAGCNSAKAGAAPGVARWLEGCGTVDPKAAPEAAARSALQRRTRQLGLRPDGRDLALLKTDRTAKVTYVRFQQTHNGVPVFAGQLVLQYDGAGNVGLINNHTLPNLALDTSADISDELALATAKAATGAGAVRLPVDPRLVIYAGSGAPALAWHVVLYTMDPLADWHVMVAADSGKIVDSWDAIARDDGSGQTYHPNAVQTTGDTSLPDNNDANSPTLQSARVNVTLAHLNSGVQTLKGSFVDTTGPGVTGCNLPYTPGTAVEPTRVYDYTRDDDRFEEVVAYAAIDGVQTWFQSLGFTNVNNRSIPVDVHCIAADNSFYSSSDKAVHMGDGGVDDGEDADIVIHEYGHSVHDNQVPGWGPGLNTEQRAMGEGFGDFLAGMYYIGAGNITYMASYKYCIGEWDAVSYNPVTGPSDGSGCLRWINGRDEGNGSDIGTYLGVPVQEHDDGRYWSASLTCIYEGMGATSQARDDIMKILLASHFSLTPDLSPRAFEDAVEALLEADRVYFNSGHATLISDCAMDRGLITSPALPNVPAPTVTVPTVGSTHVVVSPVIVRWDTNGAPGSASYSVDYTDDCTPVVIFSDDVENGTNGWTVSHVGGTADWARVTTDAHSPTTSWFASDAGSVNDQYLVSPSITLTSGNALSFWHRYDMEPGFDGGVVEISTNGVVWTDLGPQMTQNGYDAMLDDAVGSPLTARQAFTGDSIGWIETNIDLSSYSGQAVQFRFRQADDTSDALAGWWVDDITVVGPVNWTSIGTTAPGRTTLIWSTPDTAGTDYCVRAKGSATGYDDSRHDVAGPFALASDPACTSTPFPDVAIDHPFCAEIRWMKDNSISTGFGDGTYKPSLGATRQAMSAFLARLAGATLTNCANRPFNDVTIAHPFCEEIKWMKEAGISTGFDGGTLFKPADVVTRQAMSAFLARLAGVAGSLAACTTPPFDDVATDHPFCKEIKWMKDAGISIGFAGGTLYKPADQVTRQAMSAFMYRLAGVLAD